MKRTSTVTMFVRGAAALAGKAFVTKARHLAPALLLTLPFLATVVPEALYSTRSIDVTLPHRAFARERTEVPANERIPLNAGPACVGAACQSTVVSIEVPTSMRAEPRRRTGRPNPGEHADYASADIAAVPGDDAIDALEQLAEQTPAFFRALGEAAERGLTYAPGKWSLKEVLGHLIDDERIFVYRLLRLARGEDRELPGFDEERYSAHGELERRSLEDLLAEYSATRAATLALLRGLPPAAWSRYGRVNGYDCSVRGLAFHIAGHELHHHRIVRERYIPLLG